MFAQEKKRILTENIEITESYLEPSPVEGEALPKRENFRPFIAALQLNDKGRPLFIKLSVMKPCHLMTWKY